ncbi:MAG: peptide-methionine (R)-S-oxide reductase MsrB [Candidatus Micrarchaeota archaeon]
MMAKKMPKTEEGWKRKLKPEAYSILRKKGTEPPFQNRYCYNHEEGVYLCGGCGEPLFASETKFDSGTGWPSFFDPLDGKKLEIAEDRDHGMVRKEVACKKCGGHLGHLFEDGPEPTGLRYCLNSGALGFKRKGTKKGKKRSR